jgi:hypothetical protein
MNDRSLGAQAEELLYPHTFEQRCDSTGIASLLVI